MLSLSQFTSYSSIFVCSSVFFFNFFLIDVSSGVCTSVFWLQVKHLNHTATNATGSCLYIYKYFCFTDFLCSCYLQKVCEKPKTVFIFHVKLGNLREITLFLWFIQSFYFLERNTELFEKKFCIFPSDFLQCMLS